MRQIIIDCNATLFDDVLINLRAIDQVCIEGKIVRTPDDLPKIHDAYFREFDGNTLKFYEKLGVRLDPQDIKSIYVRHYLSHIDTVSLFHGVHETLAKIRDVMNIPLALVTSNTEDLVRPLFDTFDLHQYFHPKRRVFLARNKAEAIQKLCREYGVAPSLACYVGDMAGDMRDSHKAGVVAIRFKNPHVPDKNFVGTAEPDYAVASYADLLSLFYYL